MCKDGIFDGMSSYTGMCYVKDLKMELVYIGPDTKNLPSSNQPQLWLVHNHLPWPA